MHPDKYTAPPSAYVPQSVARDGTLSDGAVVLYATLACIGEEDGGAAVSPGELAPKIGVTGHSIRKWSTEIESIDGVTLDPRARGRWVFDLGHDRRELIESGPFARVPLILWNNTSIWTMPMRRLWIVVWSYCGNGHGCFAGMERLARECGRKERATRATLRHLEREALIHVIYRRWATSDLLPFDGEQFMKPGERNETADLSFQGRNETADLERERNENARRAERKRIASVTKTSIERNETAAYLPLTQLSTSSREHDDAMRRRDPVRRQTKRAKQEYVPPDGQELEAERARQLEGLKALEKSA